MVDVIESKEEIEIALAARLDGKRRAETSHQNNNSTAQQVSGGLD